MRYFALILMVLALGCNKQSGVTEPKQPIPPIQPTTSTTPKPIDLRGLLAQPDISCQTNDDCRISRMSVGDDGTCCHLCNMAPMNKATFDRADTLCRKHYGSKCPQKKCVGGEAVCQKGQCVVNRL